MLYEQNLTSVGFCAIVMFMKTYKKKKKSKGRKTKKGY